MVGHFCPKTRTGGIADEEARTDAGGLAEAALAVADSLMDYGQLADLWRCLRQVEEEIG